MQASKHQAAASSSGLSIMCMITDEMQPRHRAAQVVRLLAAVVEQMMHTTSPGNSGSHHKWHMGQLRRRLGRLLQAQEAGLEGRPGRRTAEAVAAVSNCYPDHRCHVACCCSSLAAKSQCLYQRALGVTLPLDRPCPRWLALHRRWLDGIRQDQSHARCRHRRLAKR